MAKGSCTLPKIDDFSPNWKTWTKMAVRMEVRKKSPKQKDGPVSRNTEQRIGASKGKCSCKYSDPYAAGERLGKCAKPDAVSATTNECACACAAVPTPTVHPPCCCAYPCMHVPFHCSDGLCCAFFSSCKSVYSTPACPFRLKCRVWARVFTSFCHFTWAHVCAPFQHQSWAYTCRGIVGDEILG